MDEEAVEKAAETEEATEASPAEKPAQQPTSVKKKGRRKPIFVLIPQDIDDLNADEYDGNAPVEPDADDKKAKVVAAKLATPFHVYEVPPGRGQKAAIREILAKHNVDLRNIERVRMFAGEKLFRVETQYNIRF